jgi:hypothetical protein
MIEAAIIVHFMTQGRLAGAVAGSLTAERGEFRDRRARTRALRDARSRWLFAHGAVASFPCGVVRTGDLPIPDEARERREELAVLAAVLPEELAFIVEPPERFPSADPLEAGSVPRSRLRSVTVVDAAGKPVPEPAGESFDAEPDVWLVLAWDDEEGETREQRSLFRSAWLAWSAARRLRDAFVAPV